MGLHWVVRLQITFAFYFSLFQSLLRLIRHWEDSFLFLAVWLAPSGLLGPHGGRRDLHLLTKPPMRGPYPHSEPQLLHNQTPTTPSNPDPNATLGVALFRSIGQPNPPTSKHFGLLFWDCLALPGTVPGGLAGRRYSKCCEVWQSSRGQWEGFAQF